MGINLLDCQLDVVAHSPGGAAYEMGLASGRYLGQHVAAHATRIGAV